MLRLRLMAWNIHGFRPGVGRIADVVRAVEPDVLIVNEAGYVGFRLWRLARRLGMARASGQRGFGRVPNAVLLRPPWRVVETRMVRLPRHRRTVRRGMVMAEAGRGGRRLMIVAVHLGLSPDERREHARIITDLLAGLRHPVVVGGDLNEGPEGPAASWIGARYWDVSSAAGEGQGLTFPSVEPRARIDYLFVSSGVRVEQAWVADEARDASDHLPVVADALLPEPGSP